ncbi:unnamed protein product [Allacma fusca]|uniref:Uncharacterized protein n=1 Tax=Allacma fusca TaxID=39272 RepID=A0A8J2JJE9_9HEXA|nr:unnamed protein product [Allacma fusca]
MVFIDFFRILSAQLCFNREWWRNQLPLSNPYKGVAQKILILLVYNLTGYVLLLRLQFSTLADDIRF